MPFTKEQMKEYHQRYKLTEAYKRTLENKRQRYRDDPEFREKIKERSKGQYKRCQIICSEYRKLTPPVQV